MENELPNWYAILPENREKFSHDDKEWCDLYHSIVSYIVKKYGWFPNIVHNKDLKNTSNMKNTDFSLKDGNVEEFPAGDYEHTEIGEWNNQTKSFKKITINNILKELEDGYRKKCSKKYTNVQWIIFSATCRSWGMKPLTIIEKLRTMLNEKPTKINTLVFVGTTKKGAEGIILVYQKEWDIGYEIRIEANGADFTISKDIKIEFGQNAYNNRAKDLLHNAL